MSLELLLKNAQHLLKANGPAILTGLAVAGTVSTAFLAAKGGIQAHKAISAEETRLDHPIRGPYPLDRKEKAKIAWKYFVPAAGVGAATIACVLGANHVSSKRIAALAGAYSLSETAFKEYKEQVVKTLSAKKEERIRDEVAQTQVDRNPNNQQIVFTEANDVICYESMTGRYFGTSMEKLKKAQNDFNAKLIREMYGSINEFWDLIGLKGTDIGEELGWTADELLDLAVSTTIDPTGKPCLSIAYDPAPKAQFYKFQ